MTALHAAQVNGRCVWVWESQVRTYLALYSSWQYGAWFPVTEASAPSLYVALIHTSALLNSAQLIVYNAELGYFGNVMVFFEFSEGTCWGFPNHGLPVSPHDTDAFLLLLQKKAARFE